MSVRSVPIERGVTVEVLSIVWMVVEAAVAISAGLAAHSLSLTAFGADSVIELAASGVLLWRLSVEIKGASPAEVQTVERRASWFVGLALLALSAYIVAVAGYDLWARQGASASTVGIVLALASGVVMPYLSRAKKSIGAQIGSAALRSDGACSMVCAYMSWTLLAGLLLNAAFGWWWLNALGGLALVYFVVHEGLEAIAEARGVEDACDC